MGEWKRFSLIMGMNFLLPFFVVFGDGIESIVYSSLSYEESRRVLIWDFQYDSYISVSCRFGLSDLYWVPSSTWVAFSTLVDCIELSLGISPFSEVLRTTSLLGGLTHDFSARLASTLWLGDERQGLETFSAWS